MSSKQSQLVVILPGSQKKRLKLIKSALEAYKQFDKCRGISINQSTNEITLATKTFITSETESPLKLSFDRAVVLLGLSDKSRTDLAAFVDTPSLSFALVSCNPVDTSSITATNNDHPLVLHVRIYLGSSGLSQSQIEALVDTVPKRYSIYEPLVLFTSGSFDTPAWKSYFESNSVKDAFFQSLLLNSLKIFGKPSTMNATKTSAQTKTRLLSHFAENAPIIESDILRRPTSLAPLYGDFGPEYTPNLSINPTSADFDAALWVSTIQNGLKQVWAPRFTMFSRGNIKEKARIIQNFNKDRSVYGQTIIDVYAGIGYFVFSYRHLGAKQVLCWEINPWSVEGLRRGALANGWKCKVVQSDVDFAEYTQTGYLDYDLVVFLESNEMAVDRVLNRITQESNKNENKNSLTRPTHFNMGLLPDSKQSYPIVINLALLNYPLSSPANPKFHVHENVSIHNLSQWGAETAKSFNSIISSLRKNQDTGNLDRIGETFNTESRLLLDPCLEVKFIHVEKIKTFAPDIWHVCGDYELLIRQS